MESNETLIEELPEIIKPPKKRGRLATILFGKKVSCGRHILNWLICIFLSCLLTTCCMIFILPNMFEGDDLTSTDEIAFEITPTFTPGEMNNLYQEIETETESIRGLTSEGNVDVEVLTDEQFSEDLSEGYSPENIDTGGSEQILLEVLGLLTKEQVYSQIYSDYASDAYAGYYDTDIEQIVTGDAQSTENYDLMTYSHEYTHYLQDKNFDIFDNDQWDESFCETSRDKCAAIDALVEGDASYTENLWLKNNGTKLEIAIMFGVVKLYELFPTLIPVLEADDNKQTPDFLIQDTSFPYIEGLQFVEYLYKKGGWELVNNAYGNPPESTEQILHPKRYSKEAPVVVNMPDMNRALGEEWKVLTQSPIGEWYLYLMLASSEVPGSRLKHYIATEAVDGWGGDSLVIYQKPQTGERVALLRSSWDTLKDAMEFGRAFSKYGSLRWGKPDISNSRQVIWEQTSDGYVELYFLNNEVVWMITPDAELAGTLIDALPLFDN